MKELASNIPITLFGRQYDCTILLAMYAEGGRPAISLFSKSPEGFLEPFRLATLNAPDFLYGMPPTYTIAKTYSENEGLWEQLFSLKDSLGKPLFVKTGVKVTCGFAVCPVIELGPHSTTVWNEYLSQIDLSTSPSPSPLSH